jgi:hypothetical protein
MPKKLVVPVRRRTTQGAKGKAAKSPRAADEATRARKPDSPSDPSLDAFAMLRLPAEPGNGLVTRYTELNLLFPPGGWKGIEEAAMEWTYVLRSRSRWQASSSAAEEHIERATDQLLSFALTPAEIQQIARARHVEVRMAASADDDGGWSTRILPWEYVIAGATRPYRHGDPITVTRSLDVARKAPLSESARIGPPRGTEDLRVLYVESAPGEIAKRYDFRGERELIDIYLMGKPAASGLKRLYSPTREALAKAVSEHMPHIVHLAGVDSHEAEILLHWQAQEERARGATTTRKSARRDDTMTSQRDGFVLADDDGAPHRVLPEALAQVLTGGRIPSDAGAKRCYPWLVCMNIENSAARLAARAVQWGAHAAIGYQDAFDAALGELFYGSFYAVLRERWDLSAAFQQAWRMVRGHPANLIGTGIVLWTDTPTTPPSKREERRRKAVVEKPAATEPDSVDADWVRDRIPVTVVPKPAINYSLLHNDGELFDTFSLKPSPGTVAHGVNVLVTLSAGPESAEYECTVDLAGRPLDLRSRIRVSLGAGLIRSLHEAIVTTWRADVTWGKHVLLRETYPVRLLPMDQWRDAETGRSWLPSFVFPRDRAVGELVARASNYVRVLRDDPAAGFEGYQAVPENPLARDCIEVDLQVQALWSAILYEWRLTYINPPPAYSAELDSQRLRTPGMIARDRHGTCIDLALLLAACLELVDIWPVIFLLNDHAFPGYWRAPDFHERFRSARPEEGSMSEILEADNEANSAGGAQRYPWAVGRAMRREVLREIREGRLVPLETVRLTENCGFDEAIEAGKENFAEPDRFEYLIDIAIAREHGITPLPLWGELQ